jgi:ubiquitin conjugation factor E4 B
LLPHLLLEAGEDRGVDPDFLAEAVSRFEDDDSAKTMLTKAMAGLSAQLSQLTMNDVYQSYVNVSHHIVLLQVSTDSILGA